jgi:hypothetical protein
MRCGIGGALIEFETGERIYIAAERDGSGLVDGVSRVRDGLRGAGRRRIAEIASAGCNEQGWGEK